MCIHRTGDGKCKKFSDETFVSYCVEGPCPDDTPTNADRIRAMSDEELAGFISQIAYARHTPWSILFERAFCDRCPTEMVELEGYREPLGMHECDFSDGTCPHGSDVAYWLRQPAEETKAALGGTTK